MGAREPDAVQLSSRRRGRSRAVSVTIREVANAAGVSQKTVSRVINNEPRVLAPTRDRVLAVIKDLGFHPNPLARGLATKLTRNLGLIVPDVANPFFARGIDGCVAVAEQHGYNVFLATKGSSLQREVQHVRALLGQHVSGIICWVSGIPDVALEELMDGVAHHCPIVFVDRPPDPEPARHLVHTAVLVDQRYVGELATQHLLSEGRRAIAYIGATEAGLSGWVPAQRRAGYRDALRSEGLEPAERWERQMGYGTIREGMIAASTLLAQRPRPDAFFAYNDLLAVGALLACKRKGLRVPDDIAIIGVDNTELATVTDPPLSSIRLHQFQTGSHAVALLLSLLKAATPEESAALSETSLPLPDLVVRGSTSLRSLALPSLEDIDGLP
ncbi:MAG: LacI family transcription regulator protein [Chloroflexi bacterium]|nr:LacI family transcription regulator protein [Chloroflexota bacterium]